jgi:hypothetical protein
MKSAKVFFVGAIRGRFPVVAAHLAAEEREQRAFVVINGSRVLPQVAGGVNSTWQFARVAAFDRF